MAAMKPLCITFAGVPGSSKSIIAHFLSERFSLPIYSTDNIRFEVREDMLAASIHDPGVLDEFKRRAKMREDELIAEKKTYIMDGSVDRRWVELRSKLLARGYRWFLIDMELTPTFLQELYEETGRHEAVEQLSTYLGQHETFMAEYAADINLYIRDKDFKHRTILAERALRDFIGDK